MKETLKVKSREPYEYIFGGRFSRKQIVKKHKKEIAKLNRTLMKRQTEEEARPYV